MAVFAELSRQGKQMAAHRPWPRILVEEEAWRAAAEALAEGKLTLLGLWGDGQAVHMALLEEGPDEDPSKFSSTRCETLVLTLACPLGSFPSVGAVHAPAIRLERAIRDLFALIPSGLPDERPWLDHGRWRLEHPLSSAPGEERKPAPVAYPFLPAEGEGLHQIPVGPVHAGIIEPGHFRFNASGETVVRLEERLGYTHKGIESLMAGASLETAARLAGRVSGDSTVAYSLAFARAVEAALDLSVPPRAVFLRALMAELERLANHLGDIGAICNDAAFAMMLAQCGVLRERVLRAAHEAFGHRLMMDRILPGGVTVDLTPAGATRIRELLVSIRAVFPALADLYDKTASLQDRTSGTGIVSPALACRFGAGGYIGRASGRSFDTRRHLAYPPYDTLAFEVPTFFEGDVNARIWVRIREVEQSLSLIEQSLDNLLRDNLARDDRLQVRVTDIGETREGLALVEGFRGDILVFVRIDAGGRIERCHLRDPSWFQWPLLEVAIKGNIVADFPLCNKSFNCSYSGPDM